MKTGTQRKQKRKQFKCIKFFTDYCTLYVVSPATKELYERLIADITAVEKEEVTQKVWKQELRE